MERPLLIYDGACPLCLAARDWLARRMPPDAIEFLPCQSEQLARRAPGVSSEACLQAIHLVLPDGAVYAGADALPHLLRGLRGWRWAASAWCVPGFARLTLVVYGWVAGHRRMLSALTTRRRSGKRCRVDGNCV
ncbi:MAG TPA: DUF393 domain-containing protein [Candidatus Hydrogenedentes bacterium]|nr:DUF393 domain-containing protein [Candidatus Hydrogenedentota bacterium]